MSSQRATPLSQPGAKRTTPAAGATAVAEVSAEGVATGRVAVGAAGAVGIAVDGGGLEVGPDRVDVGADTPEHAAIANAANSVMANGRRILSSPCEEAPQVGRILIRRFGRSCGWGEIRANASDLPFVGWLMASHDVF